MRESTKDTLVLPAVPSQLLHTYNAILIGGPDVNQLTRQYQRKGQLPVHFGPLTQSSQGQTPALAAHEFAIGCCVFSGPGVGLVTIFPMATSQGFDRDAGAGGNFGLLIAGTDPQGLKDALSMGQVGLYVKGFPEGGQRFQQWVGERRRSCSQGGP